MAWQADINSNGAVAEALREALEREDTDFLGTALANDKYAAIFGSGPWTPGKHKAFHRWEAKFRSLPHDVLVDAAFDVAAKHDTADNGGSVVWIDRQGCSRVKLA